MTEPTAQYKNMMTKFEAETKKEYLINKTPVTAREKLAWLINSNWIYSRHWLDETWVAQAKKDCKKRMAEVQEELDNLKLASRILEHIDE